ncbi:hypothetical protein NQZ68_007175 [Dissostichus eleginoides]|nr:hypothetical protein NQZ68_007175 [Dissostichus eleginoides]
MIHSRIEPGWTHSFHGNKLVFDDIEDSFQDNEKAGVVYLDLTAAPWTPPEAVEDNTRPAYG